MQVIEVIQLYYCLNNNRVWFRALQLSLPDYFHAVYLHYFTCSFSTSCNPASDGKVRISLGIGGPSRSAFESTAVHTSCSVRTHTCGSKIHWTSTTTRAKRTKRCSEIAMSQLPRALLLRMPSRLGRYLRPQTPDWTSPLATACS